MTLDDLPTELRDAVRDFADVFVREIADEDEITLERVAAALRAEAVENPRGVVSFYSTARNQALYEVLWERLRATYDEFRAGAPDVSLPSRP